MHKPKVFGFCIMRQNHHYSKQSYRIVLEYDEVGLAKEKDEFWPLSGLHKFKFILNYGGHDA